MQTVRIGYVEIGEGRPCIIAPLTSSSIDGVMDTATSLADLPVELAEWRIDMFADAVVETPEGLMPDLPYILQSRFNARYGMLGAGALRRPRGLVWGGRREEGS